MPSDAPEDRRARIDRLFEQALDLPPDERQAFVDAACATEPDLRPDLLDLLRLASEPASLRDVEALCDGPLWRELCASPEPEHEHAPGTRVGPWRLLEPLGRGGMGSVYAAARADGEFEQHAALKLLHPGIASEEALRRFEQERQILAGLDHPAIARLLDGGRTADGRPYFAMELAPGRPLDRYCDEERLSVTQRLRLFAQVGRAVEHAHRNLVVHRDLKPSNIVVTGEGRVKLLDFGIAKLLGPESAAEPLTRSFARVLTPEYASPEQVLGRRVTVASDVYQLGLLLFELLTGRRPYYLESTASAIQIEKVVCHAEPPRPSAIAGLPDRDANATLDPREIAARRRTTPRGLARRLRGDLDTIALEALRKQPDRRYSSVARLVDDVERHLAGRPVLARGDGLAYRAARFVVRNRWAVSAASCVVLLLGAWAVSATLQARSIARERDRAQAEAAKAEQVKQLVLRLFQGVDPEVAQGREMSARELLEWGWAGIEDGLAGQPDVQVELLNTVGEVYRQLGVYDRAGRLLERALALARRPGGDSHGLAAALANNGRLKRDRGDQDAAEALLREALALRRQSLGGEHPEVLETVSDLGLVAHARGDYRQAEALFRQALAVRRRILGSTHPQLADSLAELGMALRSQGDYAAAEPLLREALGLRRRLLPERHPQLATSLSNLALVEQNLGAQQAAESLYREALAVMIQVRGEDHPYVAVTMNNLGRLLRARGELEEAEALLRRALAIRRRALGDGHPQVAMNLNDLGRLLYDKGDLASAERLYRQALAAYAPDHPWRSASVSNLGRVREDRGDYAGAERLYREALIDELARYGEDHERVGIDLTRLGVVLQRQGDLAGAEPPLRRALEIFRKRLPDNHTRLAEALVPLGTLLLQRGRPAAAEPLLREALDIRRAGLGLGDPQTAEAARALRRALAAQGRRPDAKPLLRPDAPS